MNSLSLTTTEILEATHGVLLAGQEKGRFAGISIDSRKIQTNDLFVAIKGQNHDGHDFINEVIIKGIKGIVVQTEIFSHLPIQDPEENIVCVGVKDTVKALGDLAHFVRKQFEVPVVAITGSNGKTSTKEMIAGILKQNFDVLATEGNFNNEIGLPLTLFKLTSSHQQVVLELGMNHPGEIFRLGKICMPDTGVITNIGYSHLEGLGSLDAVKQAKGELLQTLSPTGKAVLNADDAPTMDLVSQTSVEVVTFGESPEATVRAESIQLKENTTVFELVLPAERISVTLAMPGKFMVNNALAAATVAYLTGLSAIKIKNGLEAFVPIKGRLNRLRTSAGINIIDDTYNANPSSVKSAISTLRDLAKNQKKSVCLGDMLELGKFSKNLHEEIGEFISKAEINRLFLSGDFADAVAQGAKQGGMDSKDIFKGTQKQIIADLKNRLETGDWVLVKGSRTTHMENIVNSLMDSQN